jgi:hypothetical protein
MAERNRKRPRVLGAASASLHSQDSISRATDALFWWGRGSDAPHYFQIYLENWRSMAR